jgi:hypothetical protein
MKQKSLDSYIQSHPVPTLVGLVLILSLVVGGIWGINKIINRPKPAPEVMTVTFGDGQNTVTVNTDGTVTITTPFGTYTQNWDKEKIRQFFANVDNLDFDLLTKFIGTGLAIQLTMGDGRVITVTADNKVEAITNQLQQILDETYGDYENQQKIIPTPLPEVIIPVPATPIPTSNSNNNSNNSDPWRTGGEGDAKVFSCTQIDSKTGKKVIVSSTVCEK